MAERVILIAEDDQAATESWERDVTEFNRKGGIVFTPVFAKSRQSALRILERSRIDCAVVDLRLPNEDSGDKAAQSAAPTGNDILEKVLLEIGVPAVVYSGHVAEASDAVRASRIKIIPKGKSGAMDSLAWLAGHEELMQAMEAMQKRFAQASAALFHGSLWGQWENSWKKIADKDVLAGVITRQTAAHLAESLGVPSVNHHPEEFYIVPALDADRLSTGDLVTLDGAVHVVVTPRCNMANDYPSHIMFALCKPMEEEIKQIKAKFERKKESGEKNLRQFATQGHSTSTHFLPPCGDQGPWLVDFREIRTMPSAAVADLLKQRFAAMSAQFIPNLVQRYASYLGRIGQPDLDCNVLAARLCL